METLTHSAKFIKLTFVVISHKIYLARLFYKLLCPWPAAPGSMCPTVYPLSYTLCLCIKHTSVVIQPPDARFLKVQKMVLNFS